MANSPARATVDVGSVIADTYTVEAVIGRGGMGSVFLASHKRLPGKHVAIKVLHAELAEDEVLARFRREAEIASRLGHPNIVTVHDFNLTPDGTPYLVLEYLRGESLAARLRNGPLPLDQVTSILRQVGSALAAAHREGIVHRDLKPQNIFLVPTEVHGKLVEIAKVLDFGISKMRGSGTVKTQESMLLGTPQYMAPEQAKGEHAAVDARTDVFALGAIVYEMLTGQPAFSGANIPEVCFKVVYEPPKPLAELAPQVPENIVAAVEQAMAKPQSHRFANVSAFVEALTGQPLSVHQLPAITGSLEGSQPPTPRVTSQEAFAQTMGPDSAGPIPRTPIPTVPHKPASKSARTIESQTPAKGNPVVKDDRTVSLGSKRGTPRTSEAPIAPAVEAPAPPISTQEPASQVETIAQPAPEPSRRSPALLVGIGLAAVAIAIVVAYVAMQRDRTPAASAMPADARDAVGIDATQTAARPDAMPMQPVDAGVVAAIEDAGARIDAAVAKRDRARPAGGGGGGGDDSEDDGSDAIGQQLAQARAALKNGDAAAAEQISRRVIRSQDAQPRQRAHAHSIHGIAECQGSNEEGALIDLRSIDAPFRNARQTLIRACQRLGYLKAVR